ncbi:MAG: leucine-rich repeat domain-containing protein, partial [Muribaculaceae bacterium]|nr:leucine-rich repeat domain-containing protein [Muribaculaceae bacterium]
MNHLRLPFLLFLTVLTGLFAEGQTFTDSNNITYTATGDNTCMVTDGRTAVGSIVIPQTVDIDGKSRKVVEISHNAFYKNQLLTEVTFPEGITSIGYSAFYDCPNLETINFPSTLTEIGEFAFSNSALTQAILPASCTSLGSGAFYYCSQLKEVRLPSSLTKIEDRLFHACWELSDINIPDGIEEIGNMAFSDCHKLQFDSYPSALRVMKPGAFSYCNLLAGVALPDRLEEIGSGALSGISFRESLTIPARVKVIGEHVINSELLMKVIFTGPAPQSDGKFISKNDNLLICVPETYLQDYKSLFPDYIVISDKTAVDLSVTLTEPGTLLSQIDRDKIEIYQKLKITGPLNGTDLLVINKMKFLTEIDLSDADIVEGGEPYYLTDKIDYCTKNNTLSRYWNYNLKYLSKIIFPESLQTIEDYACASLYCLTQVEFGSNVSSIGAYAFSRCTSLSDIDLPDSVEVIGPDAFTGTGLIHFKFPPLIKTVNDGLFNRCLNLKTVELNDNISLIKLWAFYECESLEQISNTGSVTTIDERAFYKCKSLRNIELADGLSTIPKECFYECSSMKSLNIPGTVTTIYTNSFTGCTAVESLTLEDGANTLTIKAVKKDDAGQIFNEMSLKSAYAGRNIKMSGCRSEYVGLFEHHNTLREVILGPGATVIGNNMFYNCPKLEKVTFSYGQKTIENHAFGLCSLLQDVELPNSITSIGHFVFCGCESFKKFTIPESVVSIGNAILTGCSSLKEVIIEDSSKALEFRPTKGITVPTYVCPIIEDSPVTRIYLGRNLDFDSFSTAISPIEGCTTLRVADIGAEVTTVPFACFRNSSALETVNLGPNVTRVGNQAFLNCTSLTSLTLPEATSAINTGALKGCSSLKSLRFSDSETPVQLHHTMESNDKPSGYDFGDCPLETVYIGRDITSNVSGSRWFEKNKAIKTVTFGPKVTT